MKQGKKKKERDKESSQGRPKTTQFNRLFY